MYEWIAKVVKRIITLLIFIFLLLICESSEIHKYSEENNFKVIVNEEIPPFFYRTISGDVNGYYAKIIHELSKLLDFNYEYSKNILDVETEDNFLIFDANKRLNSSKGIYYSHYQMGYIVAKLEVNYDAMFYRREFGYQESDINSEFFVPYLESKYGIKGKKFTSNYLLSNAFINQEIGAVVYSDSNYVDTEIKKNVYEIKLPVFLSSNHKNIIQSIDQSIFWGNFFEKIWIVVLVAACWICILICILILEKKK